MYISQGRIAYGHCPGRRQFDQPDARCRPRSTPRNPCPREARALRGSLDRERCRCPAGIRRLRYRCLRQRHNGLKTSIFSISPVGGSPLPCAGLSCTPVALGSNIVTASYTVPGTGNTITGSVTVYVGGIKINPPTLPGATEGEPYSATLTAEGGEAPYTWAVTAGALPEGVNLDPSTGGDLSGTPTKSGESTFEVTVTDKLGATAKAQYALKVREKLLSCTGSPCVAVAPGRFVMEWEPEPAGSWGFNAGFYIDGVLGGCKSGQGQGCNYVEELIPAMERRRSVGARLWAGRWRPRPMRMAGR